MTASSEPGGSRRPPQARKVVVPQVEGLNHDDARIVLEGAGFHAIRLHYRRDYAPEGEVLTQTPRPGLLIEAGREVLLEVSQQSLVEFLPTIYQQSAEADRSQFLVGYLYIIQHLADPVNRRLDRLHELFDPRQTDVEFLPWLASWLAISLDPNWDELRRRKMLGAATELFAHRGTPHAIREFVRIYTGANVRVAENEWPFSGFRVGVSSVVGVDTVILPPMNLAHCFVVHLDRPASQVPEEEIIKIHQIVQGQKPAHTSYFLAFSDETDAGAMGSFMEIGAGAMGIGMAMGAGMGVGVSPGEPILEPQTDNVSGQKTSAPASSATKAKPRKRESVVARKAPAASDTKGPKAEASKKRKGDEAKAGAMKKSEGSATKPADEKRARGKRKSTDKTKE